MVCSILCFFVIVSASLILVASVEPSFDQNYVVSWGSLHVQQLDQGREIQLTLDESGGAGLASKLSYSSGFFSLRIKFPASKDTAGVVLAYYLKSLRDVGHDELDFEFLGSEQGQLIRLQTNVFVNGIGGNEQRIHLWFDPAQDFHTYKILWNQYQVVFFVDETPIRVYWKKIGVEYPFKQMYIDVSLWNATTWTGEGGKPVQTNWAYAPFLGHFQGFNIDGCSSPQACSEMWWNGPNYGMLHPSQLKAYEDIRRKFLYYDYCSDRQKHHGHVPPEC